MRATTALGCHCQETGSVVPLGLRAQPRVGIMEALAEQLLDEINTVCMPGRVDRQKG